MRVWLLLSFLALILCTSVASQGKTDFEDNEFAEFEDEDIAVEQVTDAPPPIQKSQKVVPEAVDDDYGVEDFDDGVVRDDVDEIPTEPKVEKLKFADVPAHFRSTWASYQVEAIILFVIAVYLVNYVTGRSQNQSAAHSWFEKCRPHLQEQFALVGDDGVGDSLAGGVLVRETDYSYLVWCSGRIGVQSLLLQLRTMKRQDLLSRILSFFTPQNDRFTMKFELDEGEQDPYVMAFGQKKTTAKQAKELLDLSTFTTEKKNPGVFNLPPSFSLFSEQPESTYALFDNAVCNILKKHEKAIECIHISDQFSGPKPPEGETFTKMPPTTNLVQFTFNFNECSSEEDIADLMSLVFYIIEKVRRLRLSKEAKSKADKRRREVVEAFMKTTHQIRQEAAQARREEKTRERKQRLMEEEDPEKQRRLERLEMKREAKAKQPKMKQLKMKM